MIIVTSFLRCSKRRLCNHSRRVCVIRWCVVMILTLILPFVVFKHAIISLELIGFQLSSDVWACLEIISATTSVNAALCSTCPEYSSVSTVATLNLPVCIHQTSQRPRTSKLYLLISAAMIDVFPVWYKDLVFHVLILVACLGMRRLISRRGMFRLFLCCIKLIEGSPLAKTLIEVFVNDSVICVTYLAGDWPTRFYQSHVGRHYPFPPLTTRT